MIHGIKNILTEKEMVNHEKRRSIEQEKYSEYAESLLNILSTRKHQSSVKNRLKNLTECSQKKKHNDITFDINDK